MKQPKATARFDSLKTRLNDRVPARHEQAGLMESAVALILAPGARGLETLFIRRAVREHDPWSGHVALPGGRREPADADRLQTAIRETLEEVNVVLPAASLLGQLDDLAPSTPSLPPLVIRPYVFGLAERPSTALSDEVAAVEWIALDELAACRARTVLDFRGGKREVECFQTRGLVIWGLTYRILTGFLALTV